MYCCWSLKISKTPILKFPLIIPLHLSRIPHPSVLFPAVSLPVRVGSCCKWRLAEQMPGLVPDGESGLSDACYLLIIAVWQETDGPRQSWGPVVSAPTPWHFCTATPPMFWLIRSCRCRRNPRYEPCFTFISPELRKEDWTYESRRHNWKEMHRFVGKTWERWKLLNAFF